MREVRLTLGERERENTEKRNDMQQEGRKERGPFADFLFFLRAGSSRHCDRSNNEDS